jgi:hypothetical protein
MGSILFGLVRWKKWTNLGLVGACAAVGRSTDAEDEHSEGRNGHDDLDVLAVDLAGENGEAGKFFVHGKHPFWLF